ANSTQGLGVNRINNIVYGENKVWASTDQGLASSTDNGQTFANQKNTKGFGNHILRGIVSKNLKRIYVGSEFGIYFSDNYGRSFNTFTAEDGLVDNFVTDLGISSNGKIIVTTEQGLSMTDD